MAKPVAVSKQLPTYPADTEQHEHPIRTLLLSTCSMQVQYLLVFCSWYDLLTAENKWVSLAYC